MPAVYEVVVVLGFQAISGDLCPAATSSQIMLKWHRVPISDKAGHIEVVSLAQLFERVLILRIDKNTPQRHTPQKFTEI